MNITSYLIITPSKKSWNPSLKLVKSLKGTMPANSIAIKLNLDIPNAIFQKPQLSATIKIDESQISKPVIDAQVLDNIQETLSQQLGIEMQVNLIEPIKLGE